MEIEAVPHPEHDAMFNVEQNLFLLSVVSDEGMQGVTVGHPANQARVGGQGDHCVALNADEHNTQPGRAQTTLSGMCEVSKTQLSLGICVCVLMPECEST